MKKLIFALSFLFTSSISLQASAQQSPWLIRGSVIYLAAENGASPISGFGASDRISIEKKESFDLGLSYFFSPNIATQLDLPYPRRHDVRMDGSNVGSLRYSPSSLHVQYYFSPETNIVPYLGLGVNYADFSSVRLQMPTATLESSSTGWSLQAGVDFKIDKNWMVNVDFKKMRIRNDLAINGAKASALQIDPWLFGVGVGYRF